MAHYDCKDCGASPTERHAPDCRKTALDELIAGDADLYGTGPVCPACCYEDASARIKGDKDRENPVERPRNVPSLFAAGAIAVARFLDWPAIEKAWQAYCETWDGDPWLGDTHNRAVALAQMILADCTDTTPKAWIDAANSIIAYRMESPRHD